jgi:hypothetical protein
MGTRSARYTAIDLDPSDLAGQTHAVANYFQMILSHEANRVHAGGVVKVATTPSAQLTGTGNTTWSADVEAIIAACGGVLKEIAVQADFAIHSGSYLASFANGASCIAAIVLKNVAGTVTMVAVKGAAATTGSQVAPTDAEIQTAVGAGNAWVKVCEATINRTGDTTVTESWDNTLRPVLGVNEDTGFGTFTG